MFSQETCALYRPSPLLLVKNPSSPQEVIPKDDKESVIDHLLKTQDQHKPPKMSGARRDIHESIRLLLGKNTKVLLKVPVKLELKHGDKTENRILVFTPHRLFMVTAKVPSRIDHQFHYLDIRCVESKAPNHIAFSFANLDKTFSFRPNYEQLDQSNSASTFDRLIQVLADAVRRVFPGVPLEHIIGKLEVTPADRIRHIIDWTPPDPKDVGPCGGFSAQYLCMCDYYSMPFREEVAWDVDTIYFSHDSHELCLQDFEHLDHRDLICISKFSKLNMTHQYISGVKVCHLLFLVVFQDFTFFSML